MKEHLIGRFAVSEAGHDRDTVYVIIAEDEKYLYLSDGRFHTLDKPKRKNRRHVRLMCSRVSGDIQEHLLQKEKLYDHQVRYAIKHIGKEEGYV